MYKVKILKHLADAAGPKSKILVIDNVITPCVTVKEGIDVQANLNSVDSSTTYEPISAPSYVPANFGRAAKFSLTMSVIMMAGFNASERTLKEFIGIFDRAGLELIRVHSLRSWVSVMELKKKQRIDGYSDLNL